MHATTLPPVLRTPMIAPENTHGGVPTLSFEPAADRVVDNRCASRRAGILGAVAHAIAPKLSQIQLNTAFNLFRDSRAAAGQDGEQIPRSAEPIAFAQRSQAIYW